MAMMDLLERAQICHDYIRALEEERNKIEVFQRELPLCLQLVTRAIESVRQQLVRGDERVKNGPVSEEFIPLRPSPTSKSVTTAAAAAAVVGSETKLDWLRSIQIWNRDTVLKVPPKKPIAVRLKKIGGGFQPFKREKYATAPAALAATQGSTITGCGGGRGGGDGSGSPGDKDKEKKEGECQPHRKARRCWSPELHRRFLNALHQLGGSHVATPKQIRELMKVDGLTHDEIKSHLQKYRLHNRRPSHADPGHSTPPTPQFVLVGGILVQPPDYAAAAAAVVAAAQPGSGSCAPPNGIYAPVASLP